MLIDTCPAFVSMNVPHNVPQSWETNQSTRSCIVLWYSPQPLIIYLSLQTLVTHLYLHTLSSLIPHLSPVTQVYCEQISHHPPVSSWQVVCPDGKASQKCGSVNRLAGAGWQALTASTHLGLGHCVAKPKFGSVTGWQVQADRPWLLQLFTSAWATV